jgi:hypothetical protein
MKERKTSKREQRQGIVKVYETSLSTYYVYQRGQRTWIEGIARGGARRDVPQIASVDEAEETLKKFLGIGQQNRPVVL